MTTSHDLLRARCNDLLPDQAPKCVRCEKMVPIKSDFCRDGLAHIIERRPLTITDVLRALAATRAKATSFYIEDDGNLWQCTAPLGDNLLCTFNLAAPLSDPSNAAACEAVLALLDSKKV